jgi:hypothetical protein
MYLKAAIKPRFADRLRASQALLDRPEALSIKIPAQ